MLRIFLRNLYWGSIIETATALKILDSHLSRHTELFDLKALTYVHKKNRIIIDKK